MATSFSSTPTNVVPSHLQERLDYDVNNNVTYAGYARMGVASSTDGWTIFQYTYSGNNQILKQTNIGGIWDNRASLTYS